VQQFILKKFKKFELKSNKIPQIVAFGENTANAHYFPKKNSKSIKKGDLIMIDIWARLNLPDAPFADITWMGYRGDKLPKDFQRSWDIVLKVRDKSVQCVRNNLKNGKPPLGKEVYQITNDILEKEGFGKKRHYTGHSIGFTSPHGNGGHLTLSNKKQLLKNLGYTIEPGIYIEHKFERRSEINFYISDDNKVILTTDLQRKILLV